MILSSPSLEDIFEARRLIQPHILRTPLIPFQDENCPAEIYLKLENLQITGAFKIRGACSALLQVNPSELSRGIWTASAGNMGAGLAHLARRLGVPCTVIIPDDSPQSRRDALAALNARVIPVPFFEYQQIQRAESPDHLPGTLVHPFANRQVMAGNASIALEILEDLPDVEAIVVPYGGGGLSCGIAAAIRSLKPTVKVVAGEVDTGAPLAASLASGTPVEIPFTPSFVSGMGAPFVFPQMWPLASRLLDAALVVGLDQVTAAIRRLALQSHVVAEPAGAVALAAALAGKLNARKIVCIVSGGNIHPELLTRILSGGPAS